MKRALVACEFSGRVRDAFKAKGWDAWSCDLLPTEKAGNHIQGDVLRNLEGWDLIVAHPPCTYLTVSGNRWVRPELKHRYPKRAEWREQAVEFFMALVNAPCPRIAVENPVGIMSTRYRKPDQVIQPWMFGHGEVKATCLWLKGLPVLQPTAVVDLPAKGADRLHRLGPSAGRWKERSRTFPGVARAMADQWSCVDED